MLLILRLAFWMTSVLLRISQPFFWFRHRKQPQKIPPTSNPLLQLSASELAKKIRLRQVSSEAVVTAYIERIKQVNPVVNAVVDHRYEDAIKEAQECDKIFDSGEVTIDYIVTNKPLFGVPFTIKESCAVKGLSFTGCTTMRRGIKADEDCLAVIKMKNAGAIALCVTNTPELCCTFETTNFVYGTTTNPYDGRRSAGGSSGGEGALLGAGASLIGVASDTAGSIRLPGLFNGIFGHKPTPGVVPLEGHYPLINDCKFQKYLVLGPMARYTEDLMLAFKIMSAGCKQNLRLDEPVELSKLKVFYMESIDTFGLTPTNEDTRSSIRRALKHFEKRGARVSKPELEGITDICELGIAAFLDIEEKLTFLMNPNNKEERVNSTIEFMKSLLGLSQYSRPAIVMTMFQDMNGFMTLSEVPKYMRKMEELKLTLLDLLGDDGVFLYPTFTGAAPLLGQTMMHSTAASYSLLCNALGFPSTQIPMGLNARGLPTGFQVFAAPHQDRLCLAVAAELEQVFGGWIPPTTANYSDDIL
ncbi:fatty-acid amide hydrolase 2 [Fopius arisanus]|uniref:FAAH2_0 protein n=1 Tax=Fopius arisanus TaxID=64838 RepID=A0A0C9RH59_9HYME|nr:PREDICTED: fatty-acid amide hydrolase 2-like [Fopius arisanus]XP_011299622.1 PREDICTED: fatty-acid amide hydrolase 2-like [Fopius arisanus]